jgi:hypothetical protein
MPLHLRCLILTIVTGDIYGPQCIPGSLHSGDLAGGKFSPAIIVCIIHVIVDGVRAVFRGQKEVCTGVSALSTLLVVNCKYLGHLPLAQEQETAALTTGQPLASEASAGVS